ncbi:MAG: CDP-glycerol glycerophosphotransferase family protein, partial [Tannerellaceae bacterium]|jgi:CDP-glycerol glycerophosphotransferase (TagB/SpsB family)|nr:CDP-glycerol glycerophosphotransferase family protein [Tannerellaceae bacterium]
MRDKKVLLCPFDYKHYTSLSRDLTLDYEKYTPGKRAYTFHEMLIALEDISSLDIENRDWVINQFWGDNDASSPKGNFDLYHKIVSLN